AWPPADELVEWFLAGHQALVDALEAAPADLQCWSFFAAPSPLAFWARRQAHETGIHRVDAERSVVGGEVTPFPADFASDGVDEVLTCFITRGRGKLVADPPQVVAVRPTDPDVGPAWPITIGPPGRTT